MHSKTLLTCGGLLVVLAMAVGCGTKRPVAHEANRGGVKGVVTIDGTPLRGGNISFISATDQMYRVVCPIGADGTFSVVDAPLGDVLVSVDTELLRMNNPSAYVPIPKKYANVKTSGLTATIAKGEADAKPLTIELKSK
jgi:hypothetical protein